MRIGVHFPLPSRNVHAVDEMVDSVRDAAALGISTVWVRQLGGADALMQIALAGREVPGIELGTAVVPSYPRHPLVMASQALTAQAACGNRLTLGIGVSHQKLMERVYGYSFDRPARHMREYLSALLPALRGEQVAYEGPTLKAKTFAPVVVAGSEPPSVLVAALGPLMLRLTAEMTDGTITWMVGPKTMANHIAPSMTAAARAAGRPPPRVVAGLPVSVTSDPEAARSTANDDFAVFMTLPSYRAMLDREGASGPGDVAIVGDEETVAARIAEVADSGATDLAAVVFGSPDECRHTRRLLGHLARE